MSPSRHRSSLQHLPPEGRHATIRRLVGQLQWHIDVAGGTQEQRHVGQGRTDREMLQVDVYLRPSGVAGQGERLVGGQVVRLVGSR